MASNIDMKLVEADMFHGDRSKLTTFITKLDTVFLLDSAKYNSELKKTTYAAFNMRGIAFEWVSPYLNDYLNDKENATDETKSVMGSWKEMKVKLRKHFGEPDKLVEAQTKIMTLRQQGSVHEYATKFRALIAVLKWDDKATIPIFRMGLKEGVRWDIRKEKPDTLTELIDTALQSENELQEFQRPQPHRFVHLQRPANPKPNIGKPRNSGFYGGPMPMDLDNANKKRNYKKGPISAKERENRIKNNLCLYCGKPGHVANDCFAKNKKPFNKGKPKQFNMAEISTKSISWANQSEPKDPEHTSLNWTGCFDDQCLTHKPGKDSGYYPRAPKPKQVRRDKTPAPTHRALCCVDGPKVKVETMDEGRIVVQSYTHSSFHISTRYFERSWCTYSECTHDAQHEHYYYMPCIEQKTSPAFFTLKRCRNAECPDVLHAHLNNDSQQRTLTVDEAGTTEIVEPSINMSDVYDLDAGGESPCDSSDEEPEPYPYPQSDFNHITIHEWDDEDIAHAKFLCNTPDCQFAQHDHQHEYHYDPRDMSRPILGRDVPKVRLCGIHYCPYNSKVGLHYHWTKNE